MQSGGGAALGVTAAAGAAAAVRGHHTGANHSSPVQQQRTHALHFLVDKRQRDLDYLQRVHQDEIHWMNVVGLTREELRMHYASERMAERAERWFFLGLSLAPLLKLDEVVRGVAQLLEEYEYYFSNAAVQGMKRLLAWTNSSSSKKESGIQASMHRVQGTVVYEFLRIPNLPFQVDVFQVVSSLCGILSSLYKRFLDDKFTNSQHLEVVLKCDAKLKHHFFGLLSREITQLAQAKLRMHLSSMDALLSSLLDTQEQETGPSSVDALAAVQAEMETGGELGCDSTCSDGEEDPLEQSLVEQLQLAGESGVPAEMVEEGIEECAEVLEELCRDPAEEAEPPFPSEDTLEEAESV